MFLSASKKPFVPDICGTRLARKCEVIMFTAVTKHRSQTRIIVSALYFYVEPLMWRASHRMRRSDAAHHDAREDLAASRSDVDAVATNPVLIIAPG
jgi:hypothetical protein